MNPNKPTYGFDGAFLEMLHDEGISLMYEGTEPVNRGECLSPNLRDSAPKTPFQTINGVDAYPTIFDKAACLFFSVVCGHIFTNGNKRTGVLALDTFLFVNEWYMFFSEEEIVTLARTTASYTVDGRSPAEVKSWLSAEIQAHCVSFETMNIEHPEKIAKMRAGVQEVIHMLIPYE